MRRVRLDLLLVERGLAPSREKARGLILAGQVTSEGARLDKAGTRVPEDAPLDVARPPKFVGRGGYKLESALERLRIVTTGREGLDVGASTGGFTQALLQAGATRVIALDVGRGQLDWGLRNDPRVHVLEGINARYLEPQMLPFRPSMAVVDVSFISLKQVLPAVVRCLAPRAEIVALVKPQFEVGRGKVGRGGIVRDAALHREVLVTMVGFALEQDWGVRGLCASALRGAEGNREFFIHLAPDGPGAERDSVLRAATALCDEDGESEP